MCSQHIHNVYKPDKPSTSIFLRFLHSITTTVNLFLNCSCHCNYVKEFKATIYLFGTYRRAKQTSPSLFSCKRENK